jgi:hypothetical protein
MYVKPGQGTLKIVLHNRHDLTEILLKVALSTITRSTFAKKELLATHIFKQLA